MDTFLLTFTDGRDMSRAPLDPERYRGRDAEFDARLDAYLEGVNDVRSRWGTGDWTIYFVEDRWINVEYVGDDDRRFRATSCLLPERWDEDDDIFATVVQELLRWAEQVHGP